MLIVLFLIQIIAVLGGNGQKCESKSLLMDIIEMVPQHQNSTLSMCEEQLVVLGKAWQDKQSWALKALDASGAGFSNFMFGQSTWLGNRFTCRAVHESILQDATVNNAHILQDVSPIEYHYMVAYIESNSQWQLQFTFKESPLIHIGLCLPRNCEVAEVEQLIQRSLVAGQSFRCWDMDAKLVYAKIPELKPHFFESGALHLLLVVACGTLLMTIVSWSGVLEHCRIVACFNLPSNWEQAWKPVNPSQENRSINGLRVVTAFSLVGVHVIWYKYFSVDPSGELLDKLVSMTMRNTYWPSMVEIFFLVSGYLTVLNFLKDEKLQQEIANDGFWGNGRRYLKQLIRRYCRLGPLQFVIILGGVVMIEYQRQVSALHITDPQDELCRRNFIRNFLFIQNLFPIKEMCGSWTWSLGCDMQLHMLAMTLLFVHTKHPKLVRWLTYLLLIVSALMSVILMEINDVGSNFEEIYHTNKWSYMSPFLRMMAYIIGGCYAYTLSKGLPTPVELILPNLWSKFGAAVLIVWLSKQVTMEQLPASSVITIFMVLLRVIIAALASHLIICGTKAETTDSYTPTRWLLAILHSEQVQRISRFTYSIYLLNPIIIMGLYHSFSAEVNADTTMIILMTISFSMLCYVVGIVATVFFEIPYNRLTTLLINSRSAKKKKNL
ncbi:nose resistant to fluoxetine protein 6 [Drosophila eugracilis]|uniref:nose resistant to fluoxetine protein 6 n=1 Tax=Drosophila eugracilis TaxID=29029 RepID=UPI0007E7A16D|nr:nose resistant to fluoxetine protein 6 [Drosophila eugracilis]